MRRKGFSRLRSVYNLKWMGDLVVISRSRSAATHGVHPGMYAYAYLGGLKANN